MIGLSHALDISKWALFANQLAINVVGHNIANVNTDGYSRQQLMLETNMPTTYYPGQLGSGVRANAVKRSYDRFLGVQVTNELQPLGYWDAKNDMLKQVESIFNESSGNSLNQAMNTFWDSWQQLADDPTNDAARTALVGNAQVLASEMNHLHGNLFQLQKDADAQVKYTVGQVNQLSDEIADLNTQIAQAEAGNQDANDYRDQRELKIQDLSKLIDINYFENDKGEVNIFTAGGRTLVQTVFSTHLSVSEDGTNHGFSRVMWEDANGGATDITDALQNGKIKGYLDTRDEGIPDILADLDRVAAGLVNEVNKLHYFGYGLNGTTNVNFFSPLTPTFNQDNENNGDAGITGDIYDFTVLSRDDYQIDFQTGTTYQITNAATGSVEGFQIRSGSNDQIVFNDGGGDTTITLTAGAYTADQLAGEIENQLEAHSSGNQGYTVSWDAANQHFLVTNDAGNANPLVLRWTSAASTAAGTLGFATAADDTLAAGQTATSDNSADHTFQYTSGADVFYGGIRYRITDGTGGGPAAGDQFTMSVTQDTSKFMEVNPDVVQDSNKVAAAQASADLPGDNRVALDLIALQHGNVMHQGKATIDEFYNGLVGSVGISSQSSENRMNHYQAMKEQLDYRRDTVSGVSLDEEMINLVKFQQAFSANGKLISAIDEMMKDLLNIV